MAEDKGEGVQVAFPLTFGEGANSTPVDVLKNEKRIKSVFRELLKLEAITPDRMEAQRVLTRQARQMLVQPIWGYLSRPKRKDTLYDLEGGQLIDVDLEIPNLLHSAEDVSLKNAVLIAPNAGIASKRIHLDSVFGLIDSGFAGAEIEIHIGNSNKTADCENVEVINSALYGKNIFRNLRGGLIKNSILGGEGVLENAWGTHLVNVDVVTSQGIKHYADKLFPAPKQNRY